MTKRIPAIKTEYRGTVFRSKLEAKYARAFDILGIAWTYEDRNFMFDDGTCYAPDFYMPEIDTFFEVKGVIDSESEQKVKALARLGNRVVIGNADGTMFAIDGSLEGFEPCSDQVDNGVMTSCVCGKHFFIGETGAFRCPSCGAWDGDSHLCSRHENVFDAAFGATNAVA